MAVAPQLLGDVRARWYATRSPVRPDADADARPFRGMGFARQTQADSLRQGGGWNNPLKPSPFRTAASAASFRKARNALGETAVRIHSGKVGGWDSPPETQSVSDCRERSELPGGAERDWGDRSPDSLRQGRGLGQPPRNQPLAAGGARSQDAAVAKGKQKHQARLDAVAYFGKDLARRAGRVCELCGEKGDLRPFDTDVDAEPSMETLGLFCARCREVADGRKDDPQTLRFLESAIWNPEPAISETAKQMIRRVDAGWAREALELLPD